MADQDHVTAVRRAIAVSADARRNGNHPFGAVLLDPDGVIVLEAENTVTAESDVTNHAEMNLVRLATRSMPAVDLAPYTLVTSCEPCAMCSGAIFWAGVGTVVFGLSETGLLELAGGGAPTLDHPCRLVFGAGNRPTNVVGPVLETEAAVPHHNFW